MSDSPAEPLLKLVAQSKIGPAAEVQTFESKISVNGKTVWPLWLGGTTAKGDAFDIQFEFLSEPKREEIERMKRTLTDSCDHLLKAIEKGTL